MDGDKKICFKVLSTEEIRKLASDWSLACDAGLLAHLEQFSEKICNQAQITQNKCQALFHDYEELHSTIDNITNQFLALQNCQFVENRVYDEETPVEEKVQEKVISEDEKEKLLLMQYKKAVEIGINLLDTHFQEVYIPPSSDSEEEDESGVRNSTLIWKPKNPYAGKKFPVLIGSNEWWSNDNVGLGGCEKNLDTDKILSESDSEGESMIEIEKKLSSSFSSTENDKNISNNLLGLDSFAEDLFSLCKDDSFHKNSVDTFKDFKDPFITNSLDLSKTLEHQNETIEESCSNNNQILEANKNLTKQKIPEKINLSLTQELAAKLQMVSHSTDYKTSYNEISEFEKNEKKNFISNDLYEEPEDGSNLFSVKITNSKVKNSLFFNNEKDDQLFGDSNNLFFETKTNIFDFETATKTNTDLFSNSPSEEFKDSTTSEAKKMQILEENLNKSLFAHLDDDKILFNSCPINVNQSLSKSFFSESNDKLKEIQFEASVDMYKKKCENKNLCEKDIDDDLFSENNTVFIPEIKSNNLLENIENLNFNKTTSSSDKKFLALSKEENQTILTAKEYNDNESSNILKKLEFSNNKSVSENKNEKNKIYDRDVGEENDIVNTKEDFFMGKETESLTKLANVLEDDDISLFLEKTNKPDTLSISSSRSSLFDDVSDSKSRLASVFEKDKCNKFANELFNKPNYSIFAEDLFTAKNNSDNLQCEPKNQVKKVNKNSLFDDDDDLDDLFCSFSNPNDNLFGNDMFAKLNNVGEKKNLSEQNFIDNTSCNKTTIEENNLTKSSVTKSLEAHSNVLFEKHEIQAKTSDYNEQTKTESLAKSEYFTNQFKEVETKFLISNNQNSVKENYLEPSLGSIQEIGSSKIVELSAKNVSENKKVKPKSPNSLGVKKDSYLPTNLSTIKNIGKLKIPDNLKLKFESVVKPIVSKSNDEKENIGEVGDQKKDSKIFLDRPTEIETNLLKCPSKDRVRIPVRRRPQSRQARQEAIRNSGTNFLTNTYEEAETTETFLPSSNSSLFLKKESSKNVSPALSNPLSPSTDEEDYFNVPELDTNLEKEDQRIFKNNLFHTESVSNIDISLLFDAPIISPLIPKNTNLHENKTEDGFLFSSPKTKVTKKKISVFGDDSEFSEDDDCSLFKNNNTSQDKISDVLASQKFKTVSNKDNMKGQLFSALDTSEDLFGEKLSDVVASYPNEKILKGSDKNINIKKKSNQPFVDPLGIMFDDQK